MFEIESDFML